MSPRSAGPNTSVSASSDGDVARSLVTTARLGKVVSITDAAVGAQMAYAGVRGGVWNVVINLKDITDAAYVADMQAQCSSLLAQAGEKVAEITAFVDQKLLDRLQKAKK